MAGFFEATNTQQSTPVYSPEGLEALMMDYDRLRQLLTLLSGQHEGIFSLLTGEEGLAQSLFGQPTRKAMGQARAATQGAGKQAGLSTRSLGDVDMDLGAMQPDMLSPLGLWAQQYAGGFDSLIDPRLAGFMRPDVINSSSSTPSKAQTATQVASTAGQIAGAFL